MKTIQTLGLITMLLLSFNSFAQDTIFQNIDEETEKVADSLTAVYNDKLSLTTKQELLFEKKVTEFLEKKADIEMRMNGKAKLDALYKIGVQESGEMRDILTGPQYDLYLKLKKSIQPVSRVRE
ncbi:MAG: hypothetical protein WBG71_11485 [Leeuwenhoekiella sp.]